MNRLVEVGLNKGNPKRLGADILVLKDNYEEVFDMYVHFRELNIYPMVCTFIPCGRTSIERQRKRFDVTDEMKIALWNKIYEWNAEHGIRFEGVSPFAGGHVCTQLRYALYISIRGQVYGCPGELFHIGAMVGKGKRTLKDIWEGASKNRKYLCEPRIKSISLPKELETKVLEVMKEKYSGAIEGDE